MSLISKRIPDQPNKVSLLDFEFDMKPFKTVYGLYMYMFLRVFFLYLVEVWMDADFSQQIIATCTYISYSEKCARAQNKF